MYEEERIFPAGDSPGGEATDEGSFQWQLARRFRRLPNTIPYRPELNQVVPARDVLGGLEGLEAQISEILGVIQGNRKPSPREDGHSAEGRGPREERIPPEDLLPANTRFEIGDRVLVHVNSLSDNTVPEMLAYNGQWMKVRRVLDSWGSAYCKLERDEGDWNWEWHHFSRIYRKEERLGIPELPDI